MIEKIFKYFKLELSGVSLQYGIGALSVGVIFLLTADDVGVGKFKGLSPFQNRLIGYILFFLGMLYFGHFIACYIKFRLKYKIYIEMRKILLILALWVCLGIYVILCLSFPWMKALIVPIWFFFVLFAVFTFYLDYAIDKFDASVGYYIENFSSGEIEQDDD